ncbi:hypothetical protein HDC92_001171 [Pedobacter sp. AK017]|nr:hypothetical protein [Pedobacter sp. AK017]
MLRKTLIAGMAFFMVSKTKDVKGTRSVTEDTKTDQPLRSPIKYLYKYKYSISALK